MKTRPASRPRPAAGHLAVIVLVFLVVAALILQGLVYWTLGDSETGRAIDEAVQRRTETAALEAVVKESLLTHYESALSGTSTAVATLIDGSLAAVTGGAVVRTSLPALPDPAPVTFQSALVSVDDGAIQTLDGIFSARVDASVPRALRRLDAFRPAHLAPIGVRAGLADTFTFDFARGTPATAYRVQARLWLVPVSDAEITAYALPAAGAFPALSSLPGLGSNSLADPGVRRGLALTALSPGAGAVSGSDGLPSSQRELVSCAGVVWSYVWSNAFRVAFTASLPANHAVAYDSPPEPAAMPDGLTADWDHGRLTVTVSNVLGSGLYVRASASTPTTVVLQQGGGAGSGPLVLYLDGGTDPGARLAVELASSINRPCVIYLVNADLRDPGAARSIVGALFLSPTSVLAGGSPLSTPLTLNGCLAAEITAFPDLSQVIVNRVVSPSWRGQVPRALLVQTDASIL